MRYADRSCPAAGDRRERRPVRGAGDERSVDVEQQQQRARHRAPAQRSNDVSGPSARANAAISLVAASMSPSDTSSTGECMYRHGTETKPVATPDRLI